MKKNILIIIILVLASLFMYSCGGGDSTNEDENTEEDEGSEDDFVYDDAEEIDEDAEPEEDGKDEEEEIKGEKTIGTFEGLEQGDYFYFLVKSEEGESLSIVVEQPDDTYHEVEEDPEAFKGKKVTVYWEAVTEYVEEAGAEMERKKYIKAEFE